MLERLVAVDYFALWQPPLSGVILGGFMSIHVAFEEFVKLLVSPLIVIALGLSADVHAAPKNLDVYAWSGTQGTPLAGYVASFATTESNPSIASLSASVNWGDGSPVDAAIVEASGFPGLYAVSDTHTYISAGAYFVTVRVDDATDNGEASGFNTATIQNAPLVVTGTYFSSMPNVAFNGLVATFADQNPYATLVDLTATINWGDGSPLGTASAITRIGSSDVYDVMGTHTYTVVGLETVTITVNDSNNQNMATGTSYTGDRIFADGFD